MRLAGQTVGSESDNSPGVHTARMESSSQRTGVCARVPTKLHWPEGCETWTGRISLVGGRKQLVPGLVMCGTIFVPL